MNRSRSLRPRFRSPWLPAAVLFAAALAVALFFAADAGARPGGGHSFGGRSHSYGGGSHSYGGGGRSYSGGGRSYSSGGSYSSGSGVDSGCGGCLFVLVVVVVILVVLANARQKGKASWDSAAGVRPPAPPLPPVTHDLDAIRNLDPEFSVVLFEDFAYALYAKAQQARSDPKALEALAPYLAVEVRRQLAGRPPVGVPVSNVIVGAMRVVRLGLPASATAGPGRPLPQIIVGLEFEANLMLGDRDIQYVAETWRLVRNAGVLSKGPEAVRSFHCPNCGAPAASERCEYCGQVVDGGRFDWTVASIDAFEVQGLSLTLGGYAEEEGTDWPTVFHPAAQARRADLLRDDPAATDEAIVARLGLIYNELNAAWTALDLAPIRPFVSDSLFDYLQYWIDAYRRQGLRNVLQGMHITRLTLARVVRDRHFDALTFRIWAAGRDWTVRQDNGQVVGGNPNRDRAYSEYWTLIRGAAVRGTPKTDKSCPNCGAPLAVNMAGQCAHCDAKITSGEFDWVLSKIEQDDSYTG